MALHVYLSEKELKKRLPEDPHLKRSLFLLKLQIVLFVVLFVGVFIAEPLVARHQKKIISSPLAKAPSEVRGISSRQEIITPTIPIPTPTLAIVVLPTPTIIPPTPTPTSIVLPKSSYKIAVVGDSMEDTMGELLEYLDHSLKRTYPNNTFGLFNYGMGSQNAEMGMERFDQEFHYQTRNYPKIVDVRPDIIIVGSYAYNPFSPYDRNRHWLALTHIIQKAQAVTPNVYILAEIAPLRADFGRGPGGPNWDTQTNIEHSGWIMEELENAVGLSRSLGLPLIDAYHASLKSNGYEGKREYVNPSDGIHPSIAGHEFTADMIVKNLVFK